MPPKKRGLGRGLDVLLSNDALPGALSAGPGPGGGELKEMPVDLIQRGIYQPRREMDQAALDELASSIRVHGVMQPIVIRPVHAGGEGEQRYEIIAGERRWRAAQMAGLHAVPAVIRHVSDNAAMAMGLIENIQRENLNPIEEAAALQRLQREFNLTQQQVADAVGKNRATVTNLMRLMNLPENVRALVEAGRLEMGHARALLGLPKAEMSPAARAVIAKGLTTRETEAFVRRIADGAKGGKGKSAKARAAKRDPDIKRLQDKLARKLGAKVQIQHTAKGAGKLVIPYNSPPELDGILRHIR